jgi:hypothetical protein
MLESSGESSPLLANAYLHYVLDLWAQQWRQRHATGDMVIVRYADDCVLGFEHEAEANRFLEDMRLRLAEFSLSLHPEKTKLIEFGRYAAERRQQRGQNKPETFTFLGFVLICGVSSQGRFRVRRTSRRDRMRGTLRGPRTFGGKTPDRGALQITDLQPLGDWAVGLLDDLWHFQAYLRSKTGKRRYRDIKETSLAGVFPS